MSYSLINNELFSFRGFVSASCKKRTELCKGNEECCPVMGRRLVCAPSLEVCGKIKCCITEVEEQQEKQAAIIRNRNPKPTRLWNLLLDQLEDEEY
jgi:hypothetical protein